MLPKIDESFNEFSKAGEDSSSKKKRRRRYLASGT